MHTPRHPNQSADYFEMCNVILLCSIVFVFPFYRFTVLPTSAAPFGSFLFLFLSFQVPEATRFANVKHGFYCGRLGLAGEVVRDFISLPRLYVHGAPGIT